MLGGGSFDASKVKKTEPGAPKVINIGLGLGGADAPPGASRLQWRDAYRRHILPRVKAFNPDLILISAGFDAHKTDAMNWGFLGLIEDDYAWLTASVVKLANKCCQGRVVSLLEGGYNIQGGPISAFAQSVAAHVDALAGSGNGEWDEDDAVWESEHENKMSREMQRRRLLKQAKERQQAAEAAAAREVERAKRDEERSNANATESGDDGAVEATTTEEPPVKRSRRAAGAVVDYAALAQKLDDEESNKAP
mmetsp:Transcript_54887/g.108930  ORF Transcript_54887/g.108930 Transcript_54887/m.108930 type:complete len:251 (+) Transcript_54887:1-753(+)